MKSNRRLKKIVDNTKLFTPQQRQRERELKAERQALSKQEQLILARELYDNWKGQMVSEGCLVTAIASRFDAFRKVLKERIANKQILQLIFAELHWAEIKFLAAYGPRGAGPKKSKQKPHSN